MIDGLFSLSNVAGWDRELRIDLVEGRLRRRKAKLALEEGGFRRVAIRIGEVQSLRRVDELLSFLHEVCEL